MPMRSNEPPLLKITLWAIRYALPPLIGLAFIAPMLWLVSTSLHPAGIPPSPELNLLPNPPRIENYLNLFSTFPLGPAFLNSTLVALVAVPVTLITASMAGFGMALMPPTARQRLLLLTVILLVIPLPALWLPRFMLFSALGLIDTLWALMLPALMGSSPFFVLLFYWTFRRLPNELYEAARLDGAATLQVWRLIALPLARPTLSVVAVLTFALYWNDYMGALVYLRSISNYTISLRLQAVQGGDVTLLPIGMAGVVVAIAPLVVLFLLVQRYFWPEGRAQSLAGR